MAIVDMSRFTLTAFLSERERLLQALQVLKEVSFGEPETLGEEAAGVLRTDEALTELAALRENLSRTGRSIKVLEALMPRPGMLASLNSALPVLGYAESEKRARQEMMEPVNQAVLELLREREELKDQMTELRDRRTQLRRYRLFDAPLEKLHAPRSVRCALGLVPLRWFEELEERFASLERAHLEALGRDERFQYLFVAYDPTEGPAAESALQSHAFTEEELGGTGSPEEQIAAIDQELRLRESRLEVNEAKLREIGVASLDKLRLSYETLKNEEVRLLSRGELLRGERVFLLKGYVPAEKASTLRELIKAVLQEPYDLEMETVRRDDPEVEKVPVLLRNRSLVTPFEPVVATFATPRYNEIDPTPVMMPWYCLCFGMMMGDAGYGLAILLLTSLVLRFFKPREGLRQSLRFFRILSIPTLIAGLCFDSFFSFSISSLIPGFPALIQPGEDPNSFLAFSIAFGLVMLFFGLGVKGYMAVRDKRPLDAVCDVLFWYFALIGSGLMIGGSMLGLPSWAKTLGLILMLTGMVGILLFSARKEKKWGGRLGWGAYNLYGITSWLGDLVSFARIAALALSGGFIGYAVNLISGMMFASNAAAKLAGILILVLFHAFNIFLSGLSGYVHTLRLVYVEFFGKFYEGGGTPFKPYRAEGTYYDIR